MASRKQSTPTPATAKQAREWLLANPGDVAVKDTRGRLPKSEIARFEQATGSQVVTGAQSAGKTVTLKVTTVSPKGRKSTKSVEKPYSEVREHAVRLGVGKPAGILSAAAIAAVEADLSTPASE